VVAIGRSSAISSYVANLSPVWRKASSQKKQMAKTPYLSHLTPVLHPMPTLNCNDAISDLVLQAARGVMPRHAAEHTTGDIGPRNRPLLPLLVALLDAATTTANAVGDNAFDTCTPLPADIAQQLAGQCRRLAANIENAAQAPDRSAWTSLSMTQSELI
jgi:hypothetical protein